MNRIIILIFTYITISVVLNNKLDAQQSAMNMELSSHFRLLGGLSLPVGDYGGTSGAHAGLAKTGFSLSAEYSRENSKGFELGVLGCYSNNAVDQAEVEKVFSVFGTAAADVGSWSLIYFMGSVGFISNTSPTMSIYGKGYAGLLYGTIPEIKVTIGSTTITQESASATTIGYGIGGGLLINEKVDVGFRYLTGEPEYEEHASSNAGSSSATVKAKIPNGTVQLIVGLVL